MIGGVEMDADKCLCCGTIIPEGRVICPICEYKLNKAALIMQSGNVPEEDVEKFYKEFIHNKGDDNNA